MGNTPEPGSPEYVDYDPFADEPPSPAETKVAEVAKAIERHHEERKTEVAAEDNWVSVTFKAHGGYDAPNITVHGDSGYMAGLLGIEDYDGRLSTLMNQVAVVDAYYKKKIPGGSTGKG